MRCDVCMTLNKEYRKLEYLLRFTNRRGTKTRRKSSEAPYTAQLHRLRIIAKRKSVLYALYPFYKNKQRAEQEDARKRGVPSSNLTVDDCVPDSDVRTSRFCELLNCASRAAKGQAPFRISIVDIILNEVSELDEESIDLYYDGVIAFDPSEEPGEAEEGGDSEDDLEDGEYVEDEEAFCEENDERNDEIRAIQRKLAAEVRRIRSSADTMKKRRRLHIVSALQKLMTLRRFHNDHIM